MTIARPPVPSSPCLRLATLILAAFALPALPAARVEALTIDEIDATAHVATSGLMSITKRLVADDFDGRNNDSPTSPRVERYLVSRLRFLGEGLDAGASGDAAYRQPFVQAGRAGTNLFALIRGRELPDEYVIVGAHYDHLGSCPSEPSGRVCNGATDNATGVAAVLAIGRALTRLPEPPRRSVLLALWDAEEDGLLGSRYYVDNPLVPLESTVAYVNFDILGSVLVPSLRWVSFAIGSETGGEDFAELVQWAIDREGLGTQRLSYIFGQLRSDYASFGDAGVPTVFFSDSTGACYHKTGDDLHLVDEGKLRAQSRLAFRLVAALAEEPGRPRFVPPSADLATYEDAVALAEVISTGQRDLRLFSPATQAELERILVDIERVVADGPADFGPDDIQVALGAAVSTINALTSLECPAAPRRRPLATR